MDASPTANYATINAEISYPQAPAMPRVIKIDGRNADPASGYRADQYPKASFFQFRSVGNGLETYRTKE